MNERDSARQDSRTVTVRLFAAAKERAGAETVEVVVGGGCVADVRRALASQVEPLRPLVPHLLFAIGNEYAADQSLIPAAGELVAFPPVSGG